MTNKSSIRISIVLIVSIILSALFFVGHLGADQESDPKKEADIGTQYQEGRHYHRISPNVATDVQEGSVEVIELFWYGCPHCFEFEKYLIDWEQNKPNYIEFVRMPAVLNRSWAPHARAYYALEIMGEIDRVHSIFFEAIHVQGRRLRDIESMTRFLSQHGIDEDEFKKSYDSFYVETKLKRSDQLVRQYGSTSVPTVIINGKFRTSASDAGGYESVLEIVNLLSQQEVKLITKSNSN